MFRLNFTEFFRHSLVLILHICKTSAQFIIFFIVLSEMYTSKPISRLMNAIFVTRVFAS